MFLPYCKRDISSKAIPENKAKVLWSESSHNKEVKKEEFEQEFGFRIKEIFGTMEEFINCMHYYKQYLHHPDLAKNRYEGARQLIDLYCLKKLPNVIHVISPWDRQTIPQWFKFQSGIVDYEIGKLTKKYRESGHVANRMNNISKEGNELVAEKLVELITDNKWI
jgi:hypothetical protein